jgi:hypothetical protein
VQNSPKGNRAKEEALWDAVVGDRQWHWPTRRIAAIESNWAIGISYGEKAEHSPVDNLNVDIW